LFHATTLASKCKPAQVQPITARGSGAVKDNIAKIVADINAIGAAQLILFPILSH
jgi:hypothetical protein